MFGHTWESKHWRNISILGMALGCTPPPNSSPMTIMGILTAAMIINPWLKSPIFARNLAMVATVILMLAEIIAQA